MQALALLRQFVDQDQRRHDGEPRVADLTEGAAQIGNALVKVMGEPRQMVLLAVVARHAELAAVDGDAHMGHAGIPVRSAG